MWVGECRPVACVLHLVSAVRASEVKAPPPTASARRIVVDESLSDAHVAAAVEATNGFSGREISKLAIAWQAAAYGSAEARFTPEIMASVLEVHVDQRERKRQWSNPKEAIVSP